MVELAEIFQHYGDAYRAKFGKRMSSSQFKAMADIEACRTEVLGGQVYHCSACDETHYSYRSCRNRHCPKCQQDAAQEWLAKQQALLLPVPYFLVTFTLPSPLRILARQNQALLYNLLFQASAEALQQLAQDERFVGGQIGMVGILQTWTRDLRYHPHIHYLVPGGGLAADRQSWQRAKNHFFVHTKPLALLFRAKLRDALQKTALFARIPPSVWYQEWVVDCKPVGSGAAALKYLAPYIFRVALSNSRIRQLENDHVTFTYKARDTGQMRCCTLPVETFITRFLQHVLPKGFVKVRYYGLLSPGNRALLHRTHDLLGLAPQTAPLASDDVLPATGATAPTPVRTCPKCGQPLRLIQSIRPRSRCPPPQQG